MNILEMLSLDILQHARVVAGEEGLRRPVRWVHIVDLPDILPWIHAGQFLLTTGYAWPREEEAQRTLIYALAQRNLAGFGMAVPQFFAHIPEVACEAARQVGLPLLEIPWDVPFASITEAVHRTILTEQTRIIEQSETIHRELTRAAIEAERIQDLAETLGKLINRAITIEDMEGHVLADYALAQEEDTLRRTTRANWHSSAEFEAHLKQLGYLQMIHTTSTPIRIPAMPKIEVAARVVCPIRLKDELVGLVWIIEGENELSELDMRAAEHAAIIIALQIAHQRALASFEAQLGYTFLDSLLEGRFEATPQALERARLLGFDPEASYLVGILVLDEALPLSREGLLHRARLARRLYERLKTLSVAPLLSFTLNRVCFLLPPKCSQYDMWKALAEKGVSLAFGQPHRGAEGIQRSYCEVLSLLIYLPPDSCHSYETLLLPRVLLGDQEAQQAFLERLLGHLRRQRNGEVLLDTLLTWTRAGFSSSSVIEQMSIHLKTLRYRLARVEKLTTLDLSDPETRFQLQLASHLLSLREKFLP